MVRAQKTGDLDVWLMALGRVDLPAGILQATSEADKAAVAKFYPDGKIPATLNVMLVKGRDYIALVDTGAPETVERLLAALKQAGVEPGQVTHVIVTHGHFDHIGGMLRDGKPVFPSAKILIHQREFDFWMNNANQSKAPEMLREGFALFQKTMAGYQGRCEKLSLGVDKEILPGLVLIPAFGHTPGHVAVLAGADGKKLFFWGDLLHAMKLQREMPHISPVFDLDPVEAAKIRKALLGRAKKEGWQTSGIHVPGPFSWPL